MIGPTARPIKAEGKFTVGFKRSRGGEPDQIGVDWVGIGRYPVIGSICIDPDNRCALGNGQAGWFKALVSDQDTIRHRVGHLCGSHPASRQLTAPASAAGKYHRHNYHSKPSARNRFR